MKAAYKWTIRFSIVTPILIIVCIFLMGGGHGWYTPAMVLFPWATLNIAWQDHLSTPFIIAGLFQFVFYGFLIDKSRGTKSYNWIIAGILLSHIIFTVIILVLRSPEWR
jgi:hypothetical protein